MAVGTAGHFWKFAPLEAEPLDEDMYDNLRAE